MFGQTKFVIESNNLSFSLLKVLNDIDTMFDLKKWMAGSRNLELIEKIKLLSEKENIEL